VRVGIFPRRRTRVDEEVPLEPGERVLASAAGEAGKLIATDRRLLVPGPGGHDGIGWGTVERATWDGDSERLTITQTAPLGSRPRQHRLHIEAAERLLDVVREQVTASVVISRYVPIMDDRGVRITGRRQPGRTGLTWVVTVDNGLAMDTPEVRTVIDAAVKAVRSEVE
jgi:hypothetical protein